MHPLFGRAQGLTGGIIAGAIDVHRTFGPGLVESIYERSLRRELDLRNMPHEAQRVVRIEYKGITFEEPLRFDVLVDGCVLVENKCVEKILPIHNGPTLELHEAPRCPSRSLDQLS